MLLTDMKTCVRTAHRGPGRALARRPDGLTGQVTPAARLTAPEQDGWLPAQTDVMMQEYPQDGAPGGTPARRPVEDGTPQRVFI